MSFTDNHDDDSDDDTILERLEEFIDRYSTGSAMVSAEEAPAMDAGDLASLLSEAVHQADQQVDEVADKQVDQLADQQVSKKREHEEDEVEEKGGVEEPVADTPRRKLQRTDHISASRNPDGRIGSSTTFLLPPLLSDMGSDMLMRVLVPDLIRLPQIEVHSDPQNHVHGTSLEDIACSWDGFWTTGQIHLDNTLAIRDVLGSGNDQPLVWTAPSGSGKSVFLSLLRNFLAAAAPMDRKERLLKFKPYAICDKAPRYFKEHFGQYPVLLFDVSRDKPRTVQGALSIVASAIVEAVKQYMRAFSDDLTSEQRYQIYNGVTEGFMTANRQDLEQLHQEFGMLESGDVGDGSLFVTFIDRLVRLLAACFGGKKTVVLIDGFDVPFAHVFSSNMSLDKQNAVLEVYEKLYQRLIAQDEFIGTQIIAGVYDVSMRFGVAGQRRTHDLFANATGMSIDGVEHTIARFVDEDWSKASVEGACPADKFKSDLMWVCHHRFGNQTGDAMKERITNIYAFLRLLQSVRKEPALMPADLIRLDYYLRPEHTDELSFIMSRSIVDKQLFDRFAKLLLGAYFYRDFHFKQELASNEYRTIQEAIACQGTRATTLPANRWDATFQTMADKLVQSLVDLPRNGYQVSTLEMLGLLLSGGSLTRHENRTVRMSTPDVLLQMLVLLNSDENGFGTSGSYMGWYTDYIGITSVSMLKFSAAIADNAFYLTSDGTTQSPKTPVSFVQCLIEPLHLAGINVLVTSELSPSNRGTFCFTLKGAARSSTYVVLQVAYPSKENSTFHIVDQRLRNIESSGKRLQQLNYISSDFLHASLRSMPCYPHQAPIHGDRLLCIGLAFHKELFSACLREHEWEVAGDSSQPSNGGWQKRFISDDMRNSIQRSVTNMRCNVRRGDANVHSRLDEGRSRHHNHGDGRDNDHHKKHHSRRPHKRKH